eukprot:gene12284-13436_t
MNILAAFPEALLKEVQSYLKYHVDWVAFMSTSKRMFHLSRYETMEITIEATQVVQSRKLPEIVRRLSHPEQQIHLKLDFLEFWGMETILAANLSSEELNEFVAWFLSSTPAKSLTWEYGLDIIDHIPNAYDLLGRFERLSILDNDREYTTIDLSRLPENNRVRVLTLNNVEFVVFGCLNNLTNLRELHVVNCWKFDFFLAPDTSYFDENYKFKDGKSHPFAEFEFPGLEKASFRRCSSYLPFDPRKLSHVRDVTFHECQCLPDFSSLKNLSSFVYTGYFGLLESGDFDEMLSYSSPLKRFDVEGSEFTSEKILEVGLNRQIRHLALSNYQPEDFPFLPTLRSLTVSRPPKLSEFHNLGHLFSVKLDSCDQLRSLEGLEQVSVLTIQCCRELRSLEGLRDGKFDRTIAINVCQEVRDFSPLNNVRKVIVCICPGFTDCSQVSGVKDLTIVRCEGLVTLGDCLKCQSLTLEDMDHLSSLKEVKDVPELYIRRFRLNHLLYELGGVGNQKMEFTEIKIPDDLPFLPEYLKFEVCEFEESQFGKQKRPVTILLRKL